MNIYEIVEKYLRDNGDDGLVCLAELSCGCKVGSLFPCDSPGDCVPARLVPCTPEECKECGAEWCNGDNLTVKEHLVETE